jgi:dATP pyrophosphohydrolase
MPEIVSRYAQAYLYRSAERSAEFLVLQRAGNDRFAGTWHAIYGKIEEGEKAWQTAQREVREETGLVPLEGHQIDFVDTFYMASEDRIHMCPCFAFRVDATTNPVLSAEHSACEWLSPEAACVRLTWPGQRQAVRQIVAEIIGDGPGKPLCVLPNE